MANSSTWLPPAAAAPAHAALVRLCRRTMPEPAAVPAGVDPALAGTIVDLAREHGVASLATRRLLEHLERAGADRAVLADLAETGARLRRRASLLAVVRDEACRAMAEAGLEPVVLKGAALVASGCLPETERDQVDLDVLVARNDLRMAVRSLVASGRVESASYRTARAYLRHHFHLPLRAAGGLPIEVHWALAKPGSKFTLDADRVRGAAIVVRPSNGDAVRVPRPEHLVLHVALQNVQEGFSRLGRLVDVDRIVAASGDLDWDLLVRDADPGLWTATWLTLVLARDLLGSGIPSSALDSLAPSHVSRFHLRALRPGPALLARWAARDYAKRQLQRFWLARGVRARFELVRETLTIGHDSVDSSARRGGFLRRRVPVLKAIALQGLLYAARGTAPPPESDQIRF